MRRLAALAAALALPALGGCGFTPLYATPGVVQGLTRVDVIAPEGRIGYLLRQDLDDAFGHEQGASPVYRLEMTIEQNRVAHGLTVNAVAQRYEIDLTVSYKLIEVATGAVAFQGHAVSEISYDSAAQPYAGIAARQSTQEKAALDVADKIQIDLAAWMATRRVGAGS